jgi:hypothetical protein
MRYTSLLIASALLFVFGSVQACPGDKPDTQTQSGTVTKPLAPKPSV